MNKLLTILFAASIFSSCCYNKAKFEITNCSNYKIDSLFISSKQFTAANENPIYKLNKKETKNICIDMPDTYIDGCYSIGYKINGVWCYENYGYYTNGSQIEKLIKIQIFDTDSLFIDYEL